jgi:hypothetical protein
MQQTAEMAPGHVRPRAALVLALVLATGLGPVWLAPAGAASPVVSSAIIPLTGRVGDIRLSGVAHVVTQVLLNTGQEPPPNTDLTVYAYLTPSDVSVGDRHGNAYLAHGAGRTAKRLGTDIGFFRSTVCVPGFILVAGDEGGGAGATAVIDRTHVDVHFFHAVGTQSAAARPARREHQHGHRRRRLPLALVRAPTPSRMLSICHRLSRNEPERRAGEDNVSKNGRFVRQRGY